MVSADQDSYIYCGSIRDGNPPSPTPPKMTGDHRCQVGMFVIQHAGDDFTDGNSESSQEHQVR